MNALSQLQQAEANLIGSIDAATARIESIGTDSLTAAVQRLQLAALAASDRLSKAGRAIGIISTTVLEDLNNLTARLAAALAPICAEATWPGKTFDPESPEGRLEYERSQRKPADAEPIGFEDIAEAGGSIDLAEGAPPVAQEAHEQARVVQTGHHVPEAPETPAPAWLAAARSRDTGKPTRRAKRVSHAGQNGTH